MQILVISHMFPNKKDAITGIFVKEPVKELLNKGHEVIVIAPIPYAPNIGKWKKYNNIPLKDTLDGIKVYYPRYFFIPKGHLLHLSGLLMFLGIKKLVYKLNAEKSFDLIHSHTILPASSCALFLKKKLKKPVVSTIHGADLYQSILKNKKCEKTILKTINKCDKTILVSSKLNDILKKYSNVNFQNIEIIHNGIGLEKFNVTVDQSLKNKYKNKRLITSVGFLIKRKCQEDVIKALPEIIKKHENAFLLIIGKGPMLEYLKELTNKLSLNNHVEFLGQIDNSLMLQYLQLSQVFALPSYDEAFGIVYIEAMVYGIPIIACEGQGISDVITHNVNGYLVKEKNSEEIAMVVNDLLSNENKRSLVGSMAKKLILENYSWDKKVDEYINVYNSVLK